MPNTKHDRPRQLVDPDILYGWPGEARAALHCGESTIRDLQRATNMPLLYLGKYVYVRGARLIEAIERYNAQRTTGEAAAREERRQAGVPGLQIIDAAGEELANVEIDDPEALPLSPGEH